MTQTQAEVLKALAEALAVHDREVAKCPVRSPKWRSSPTCPTCRATASEGCGLAAGASYTFIAAARALAAQEPHSHD